MNQHEFTSHDISCQHCINAITHAIRDIDNQAKVKIDLASQKIWVDSTVAAADIAQAIQNAGYKLT